MSYEYYETSVDSGEPIELYFFTYGDQTYQYTSAQEIKTVTYNGISYSFNPTFIKRSDTLKLGASNENMETTSIIVARTNNIALLYQGAPPEDSKVSIQIYRYHADDPSSIIKIMQGVVSQVRFYGSSAELTITIENILQKNIPNGTLSYYCQNQIYDSNCGLSESEWGHLCYVDGGFDGLWIYSSNLLEVESGYFTDGFIKIGNSYRAVVKHVDNKILIKYPINESNKEGSFMAYPGCNCLFLTCNSKFNNTDNFTGVPYCKPIDAVRNRTGYGGYWISDTVITRDSSSFVGTITGV